MSIEQNLNRYDRGTTPAGPGGKDRDEMRKNLKPAPRKSDVVDINNEPKHDLRLHFKDFMSTNPSNMCKRARSFSQPRDKRNSTDRDEAAHSESKSPKKKCITVLQNRNSGQRNCGVLGHCVALLVHPYHV